MGSGKKWTKEEKEYLEEAWGSVSISYICKKLGRSKGAIENMRTRLGLGRFLENGEYITYSLLLQTVFGIEDAGCAYREMKRAADFPIRMKRRGKGNYKVVYLDDFWEWAEDHKRHFDFSKMAENSLGAEPDWVKRKRKIDYECQLNTSPWTRTEDVKLKRMIDRYQYSYAEIATELHRSEGAVKRRLFDLGIKGRPLKAVNRPWQEGEVQILVFMYEEGYSFERIGKELGRSALCCRGKMERIENPEYFLRVNRKKREHAV